jgi:WD40 repeat protein
MSEEQSLWRNLFEGQGWGYDRKEIHQYLLNAPEEEDYHAGSSGNGALSGSSGGGALSGSGNSNSGNSSNSAGNAVKTLSPVPITRTSSPLIGKSKWSRIYNLKNKAINRQQQKEDELEAYHYDHNSDTRIINWQRLYRNRYMIEQQWLRGSCETKRFPPNDANPQSDLHTEGIYTIQFDKEKVVTGSRDRSIKIWDAVTGRCKQTLRGHTGSVLCLQYDKDTIVSGSSDATLIVADLESGMIKKKLVGHGDSVLSLRLVNSDQVISCSKDRSLRLWDKNTGDCLKILLGHHAPVNAVQWKDNRIVSGSGDRTIKIWDLDTGKCLKTLAAHVRGVACLEFDGDHIVSGSSDQTIKVWNAITGDCIYTLVGHTELVRTLQLDTTASRIISGCYNGHLKIWSLHEGRLIRDLGQATEGR